MSVDLTAQTKDMSSHVRGGDGKYRTDDPSGSQGGGSPVITGITGTWGSGNLMISGSGFGANGPTILAADNFAGKTDGQALATSDPQIGTYASIPGNGEYDTEVTLGGNATMKYTDEALGWGVLDAPIIGLPGASDAIRQAAGISVSDWLGWHPFRDYVVWIARYGNNANYNSKDVWAMLGNRGDNPQVAGEGNDLVLPNDSGASINVFSNQATLDPTYSPANAGRWAANEWNYHLYQNRLVNGPDGNTEFYIRGHVPSDRIGEDLVTDRQYYQNEPTQPPWTDRFKLGAYAHSQPSGNKRWFGGVYVAISDELSGANTKASARVEFFDNADPDLANVYGILPHSGSWAGGSLTVDGTWDLGVVAANVYVRVVTGDNQKSPLFKLV